LDLEQQYDKNDRQQYKKVTSPPAPNNMEKLISPLQLATVRA